MKCGAATLSASGIARDSVHPGLVSIPGSQSVLETLAPIVRPAGALGGGALSPKLGRRRSFSRENLSLTPRRQPASDPPMPLFDNNREGR